MLLQSPALFSLLDRMLGLMGQGPTELLHVIWQRAGEPQLLPGAGVLDTEDYSVQAQSGSDSLGCGVSVAVISEDWHVGFGEVNPDLVGSASVQLRLDQVCLLTHPPQ
jgi:hypothetical protein